MVFCGQSLFTQHLPCVFLLFLFLVVTMDPAQAHGARYEILHANPIAIKTSYETGEPIACAEVRVYAPGETEPGHSGMSDANGIFCFLPDRAGAWVLEVCDALGHGMRIHMNVSDNLVPESLDSGSGQGWNLAQKVIMAICVVWGSIGTALYFKRKGQA
ncbi:MAG: carboxypeptidase regulatory-like domain-containing protein [Planctomycetota bacterium]